MTFASRAVRVSSDAVAIAKIPEMRKNRLGASIGYSHLPDSDARSGASSTSCMIRA